MPAKVFSAATIGIDALPIEVEVDVSGGLHSFHIVGLPDKAVEESKERVSSAIKNSGAQPPIRFNRRVTVNLAPADFKKEGAGHDLPIAIGFLVASGQISPFVDIGKKMFVGELSLEGTIRRVSGALPIVEMATRLGFDEIFLPKENLAEVTFLADAKITPVSNLTELIWHLEGKRSIRVEEFKIQPGLLEPEENYYLDMKDIAGQEAAKRALEIAAAGGHNVLLEGPPGTGKTLLARALASILPRLTLEEAIEITKIYSVSGLLNESQPLIRTRPFRSPHHTASGVAIIGGGQDPKAGSLAHRGVLFLDEFPEFSRSVIENLRQPMEDGLVTVSRAKRTITFPAKFTLVAAMNPCPCGWYGDPKHECHCAQTAIIKYRQKLSGPIRDRLDLSVQAPRLSYEELGKESGKEASLPIRARVEKARFRQKERFFEINKNRRVPILTNAEMGPREIRKFCALPAPSEKLLKKAETSFGFSPRTIHKILKTSRTIADLEGAPEIREEHLAEALSYRETARFN